VLQFAANSKRGSGNAGFPALFAHSACGSAP
jgi:hypothetical protein